MARLLVVCRLAVEKINPPLFVSSTSGSRWRSRLGRAVSWSISARICCDGSASCSFFQSCHISGRLRVRDGTCRTPAGAARSVCRGCAASSPGRACATAVPCTARGPEGTLQLPERILEKAVVETRVVCDEEPAVKARQDFVGHRLKARRCGHHCVGDASQRLDEQRGRDAGG